MLGPVSNQFPTLALGSARIAICGESPGEQECKQGKPFVGPAGLLLDKLLGHAGIARAQCFVGNVCQYRPSTTSNDFDLLDWNGPEVQDGIKQLQADLAAFRPTMVLCLGNAALHLFLAGNVAPPKGRRKAVSQREAKARDEMLESLGVPVGPLADLGAVAGSGGAAGALAGGFPDPPAVSPASASVGAGGAGASPAGGTGAEGAVHDPASSVTAADLAGEAQLCGLATCVTQNPETSQADESGLGGDRSKADKTSNPVVAPARLKPRHVTASASECQHEPVSGGGLGRSPADVEAIYQAPVPTLGSYTWPNTIGNWRGSLFRSRLEGLKCMATYHPAALLRDGSLQQYVKMDLRRLAVEARDPELRLPQREIIELWPSPACTVDKVLTVLNLYRQPRAQELGEPLKPIAVDTEGTTNFIPCIGFSGDPACAHVIPFVYPDGTACWSEDDEIAIWQAIDDLLASEAVPKVFQNYLHDAFTLAWTMGIVVRGSVADTMLESWEINCELEKGLAAQASWLTREPFWKRNTNYRDRLLWVCGMDCCVTLECHQRLEELLNDTERTAKNEPPTTPTVGRSQERSATCDSTEGCESGAAAGVVNRVGQAGSAGPDRTGRTPVLQTPADHCAFNHQRLPIALYKALRGVSFDRQAATAERQACEQEIYRLQDELNRAALDVEGEKLNDLWLLYKGHGGGLLTLAVAAFCRANPTELQSVTVERWQPMRWKAAKKPHPGAYGRFVKAGKLVFQVEPGSWQVNVEHDSERNDGDLRYKPMPKSATRRVPVALTDWSTAAQFVRPTCARAFNRVRKLAEESRDLTEADRGELSILLNCHVNIGSTGQDGDAIWLLYTCFKLPKQYAKAGGRNTTRLTSDDDALLSLYAKSDGKDRRVEVCLLLRQKLKEMTYLRTGTDPDGRVRHIANVVGTPTGRETVYASPTSNSCVQMQTVSKPHRHLWTADACPRCGGSECSPNPLDNCPICGGQQPFELNQDDLKGADSWTVAAHAARLGDRTMLDDLQAGLKIQSIIALIYERGESVNALTREELRPLLKSAVDEDSWQYKACKRVLYMTLYLGGGSRMSQSILSDAWKTGHELIYVEPQVCREIQQRAVFVRYPGVARWHRWWEARLVAGDAVLQSSFGHRHVFHGRKTDIKGGRTVAEHAMLKAALATEPQLNTGYCNQLAEWRMWYDPENRLPDGSLRVEPLLTVHDCIVSQNAVADRAWSLQKRREWFNNEVEIAGQRVVLPVGMSSGGDWGMKG